MRTAAVLITIFIICLVVVLIDGVTNRHAHQTRTHVFATIDHQPKRQKENNDMWILTGLLLGSIVTSTHDNEEACRGRLAMLSKRDVTSLECRPVSFTGVVSSGTTIIPNGYVPIYRNREGGGSGGVGTCSNGAYTWVC